MTDYVLLVNDDRTTLVTIWPTGEATLALRDDPSHTWGPPVALRLEGMSVEEMLRVLAVAALTPAPAMNQRQPHG